MAKHGLAAAERGSFRRAAEELQLRQSTLSRSIRQLEERLEIILFERLRGGVGPTPPRRLALGRLLGFLLGCVVAAAAASLAGDWAWSLPAALAFVAIAVR